MCTEKRIINILMAEDDPEDRMLVKEAWEESCLINNLNFVCDGEELMDYLYHRNGYKDVSAYPRPELILLDLNMPKKDGREALGEIKSDDDLKDIPVVILTTSKAEEDLLKSYNLGANSFITKPVTFESMVNVVKTLAKYWFEIVALVPDGE